MYNCAVLFTLPEIGHAHLAFIEWHFEGSVHHLGRMIQLVRIDDEGLVHHFACAGERRQDQHTRFFDLAGYKLFGHKIHSVPERCHHSNGGIAIESSQLGLQLIILA